MNGTNTINTAQQALTLLVEETVEGKLRRKEPFTALDISNALKDRRFPVHHREVAPIVRDIYTSGAMAHYDYDRRLIDVVADGGKKQAQAFLYLHDETKEREYDARDQEALPPVPADQARSLDDAVPAGNPVSPLQNARRTVTTASQPVSSKRAPRGQRRDGALAVPRSLIAQAGWKIGEMLTLSVSADPGFSLEPGASAPSNMNVIVRVWADFRVRICKTKLRITAVTDPAAVRLTLDGEKLRCEI